MDKVKEKWRELSGWAWRSKWRPSGHAFGSKCRNKGRQVGMADDWLPGKRVKQSEWPFLLVFAWLEHKHTTWSIESPSLCKDWNFQRSSSQRSLSCLPIRIDSASFYFDLWTGSPLHLVSTILTQKLKDSLHSDAFPRFFWFSNYFYRNCFLNEFPCFLYFKSKSCESNMQKAKGGAIRVDDPNGKLQSPWTLYETRKVLKQSHPSYLNHKLVTFSSLSEFASWWCHTPYKRLSQLFYFDNKAKM